MAFVYQAKRNTRIPANETANWDHPGPDTYKLDKVMTKKPQKLVKPTKSLDKFKIETPGPGQYNPQQQFKL